MLNRSLPIGIALLIITVANFLFCGCGPRPPVAYQQLQIQDAEEAKGYDVYLYVAIDRETPRDKVESLLKWFDQVKFLKAKKIRIFVWDNPQAALMNSEGNILGTLNVDREKGIFELNVGNTRR